MNRVHAVCILWVVAGACVAPDPSPPAGAGSAEAPIVRGFEPDDAQATVVLGYYLWGQPFLASCSGSLLAPNLVLTAKHCIPDWRNCEPYGMVVGVGPTGLDQQVRINEAICTPNNGGRTFENEDMALVVLQDPVRDVTPYAVPWGGDEMVQDQGVELRGYGRTERGGSGQRLATRDQVYTVFDEEFTTRGNGACQGDSGGTAVDEYGRVVGVMVRAPADDCVAGDDERPTYLTRVQHWLDLVGEGFRRAGVCAPEAPERCDGFDNDCDGVVDEGCGAAGDGCDTLVPATGCAQGLYCRETGCGEGVCTSIGGPADAPYGTACGADVDCATLRCADVGGDSICTVACAPDGGMCGVGQVCSGGDAACSVCVGEPEADGGPRGLGEPCRDGDDCGSGACIEGALGGSCTRSCGDDAPACPAGYRCDGGSCLRGTREGTGEPCLANADCLSGVCARWDEGWACAEPCVPEAEASSCPEGLSCVAVGDEGYCKPDKAVTGEACGANADCLSGLCGHFSESDTCTEVCDAWNLCPPGLECQSFGDRTQLCVPPTAAKRAGGCSILPASPDRDVGVATWGAAVSVLALVLRARRRPR